jgi:hypothetical protein
MELAFPVLHDHLVRDTRTFVVQFAQRFTIDKVGKRNHP